MVGLEGLVGMVGINGKVAMVVMVEIGLLWLPMNPLGLLFSTLAHVCNPYGHWPPYGPPDPL